MTTAVPACLQALELLPPGATLRVPDVAWSEYERVISELASSRPGVRVTFIDGSLYAVSPLRAHELYARTLAAIAESASDALGFELETVGSTTLKDPNVRHGVEPDAALYIANAPAIRGKLTLDLAVDPPPDIVIEVNLSRNSVPKFPIYAAFGVPEIWRYDGANLEIWTLTNGSYTARSASLALPQLTASRLDGWVAIARAKGYTSARRACKDWIASQD